MENKKLEDFVKVLLGESKFKGSTNAILKVAKLLEDNPKPIILPSPRKESLRLLSEIRRFWSPLS